MHIITKGVTRCPAPFSQEMIDMNIKSTAEWRAGLAQTTRDAWGMNAEIPKKERKKHTRKTLKDYRNEDPDSV